MKAGRLPSRRPSVGSGRIATLFSTAVLQLVALLLDPVAASFWNPRKPITLAGSGGFAVGGTVIVNPENETETLHCDHGYMEYFNPWTPRKTSLVMWHSSSTQTWQNRWDGGPGFKDMFLQHDYPVFLWDGPRVGRAGWACVPLEYTPAYRDQENFVGWNFGPEWKVWWPGVSFPTKDDEAWNQATRARYPEHDMWEDVLLESATVAAAADSGRLGDSIVYLTNSAAGYRAHVAATQSSSGNIKGIVSYESIGCVLPESANITGNTSDGFGPAVVPDEDFQKLADLKGVQFVWGAHRDPTYEFVQMSYNCTAWINKFGGNAEVLWLPDAGLKGNTHIPFADMNNEQTAKLLDKFLKKNKLDKYKI